jgi:hypothetical protein
MGSAILLKIIRQQFEGFLGIFFILINRILSFSQIAGFALIVFAWFVFERNLSMFISKFVFHSDRKSLSSYIS